MVQSVSESVKPDPTCRSCVALVKVVKQQGTEGTECGTFPPPSNHCSPPHLRTSQMRQRVRINRPSALHHVINRGMVWRPLAMTS